MAVQATTSGPILFVEGPDDKHVILQLLRQHGVEFDVGRIKVVENLKGLLDSFVVAAKTATGSAVGAVLDADSPLENRWNAVRNRLNHKQIGCPAKPVPEGFVTEAPQYKTRVGVWLMPDNQHDGKLETFLQELIGQNDLLIEHAEQATDQARALGAQFSDPNRQKAVVHAWLAWQKEPGLRLGTAVGAKFFDPSKPTATAFVDWFRKLFQR